jgi:hypothetical protein
MLSQAVSVNHQTQWCWQTYNGKSPMMKDQPNLVRRQQKRKLISHLYAFLRTFVRMAASFADKPSGIGLSRSLYFTISPRWFVTGTFSMYGFCGDR